MYLWLYYLLPTFSILAENKNKCAVLFSVVVMASLVSFFRIIEWSRVVYRVSKQMAVMVFEQLVVTT